MTDTDLAKIVLSALTLVLGIAGFLWGLYVFLQQKRRDHELAERQIKAAEASDRLNRFEKFQDIQTLYRTDPAMQNVLRSLYPSQQARSNLRTRAPERQVEVSEADKFTFMGYYEELAVMINSGLMNADFAYWTIGLDAVNFYNKEQGYHKDRTWTLFNRFARKAEARFGKMSEQEIISLKF